MVEEQINGLLKEENWGLVYAGIENLHHFRNTYGFVAADDVLRAISVLLNKAMDESGESGGFIGHIDDASFVLMTTNVNSADIAEHCEERLDSSIPYFYPIANVLDNNNVAEPNLLSARVLMLSSTHQSLQTTNELLTLLRVMLNQQGTPK